MRANTPIVDTAGRGPNTIQRWTLLLSCLGWFTIALPMAHSQDDEQPVTRLPNWKLPTLGGKQMWTDHFWRQGWRIQQNAMTGHWRLLDGNNVRHAWGNRAACDAALQQQGLGDELAGAQAIVLLHGLMRSASSMSGLAQSLSDTLERPLINFEYASTRSSIGDHAAALRELIAGLPAEVRLSFVGHSMGNIVVRHALGDWQRAGDQATLARVERVVMLGPPNQGAAIARQLAKTGIFGWVTGKGGMELGPNWTDFEAKLAIPPCPFGIVAGHLPESNLRNPLIDGASDFVVSVEETHLPGETDFLEVPRLHSFLMDDPVVQQAVANFILYQRFIPPN
jgi:hypothetical protein